MAACLKVRVPSAKKSGERVALLPAYQGLHETEPRKRSEWPRRDIFSGWLQRQ